MYVNADCFVMPSYREGFPNTVLEAGAMGLPSIVTDINGSREIIENEKNGLLFPHEDAKALADLILQMATDVDARNRVIDACQKKASQYDIKVMAEKYNNLYKL